MWLCSFTSLRRSMHAKQNFLWINQKSILLPSSLLLAVLLPIIETHCTYHI